MLGSFAAPVLLPLHSLGQPLITADAGPDAVLCAGGSVVLGGEPSAAGGIPPYTYYWTPPLGLNNPLLANPICTAAVTVTYTLVVTDATGSVATDQVTVTVLPSTTAEVSVVEPAFQSEYNGYPTFTQCAPDASALFSFFNSGTVLAGSTFTVDWGDGSPPYTTGQPDWTTQHIYTSGLHTLTYTVAPPDGCPESTTYQVFLGTQPGGAFSTDPNTSICQGEVLSLYISNTASNTDGTEYIVDPGDGGPNLQFPHPPPAQIDHTYLASSCPDGSFTAYFTAVNPCGQSLGQISPIRVSETPAASFSQVPDGPVCVDEPVTFSDQSSGQEAPLCGPPVHLWRVAPATVLLFSGSLGSMNGQPDDHESWTSGSAQIVLYFLQPGTYTITDRVGSICGQDSTSATVVVDCITGIAAAADEGLQLMQGPAAGAWVLQRPDMAAGELLVTDMTGRTVLRQRLGRERRIPIDLGAQAPGAYLLTLLTGHAGRTIRLMKP